VMAVRYILLIYIYIYIYIYNLHIYVCVGVRVCVCVFICKPVMAVRCVRLIYICIKSVCVSRDRSIDLKID